MSLSAFVLSARSLETIGAWQAAIDALGFKLTLTVEADQRIDALSGHLPAVWEGHEAGFECELGDAGAVENFLDDCDEAQPRGPWSQILEIYYVGIANIAGVAIAGAVYAHATGGVFWNGEDGERVDAERAIAYARKTETDIRDMLEGRQV
ncbi:hypothetical protein [Methylobacterium sp. Leaf466]|uniref:hypothetical protein n=1 Tax=Methylobacterium sp. Leaf466 TaxID=1736386 RepID=UPI0006FD3ABF|nr:hypothetical protein [Methylobacterium sp. Leaf466]KQT90575.1 hypothetical protein ASG59_01970 [Methylobacterium sp. Leaf466]